MNELVMSPVDYGGLRLKNRIIFAPTTLGLPREAYHEQIRRIAGGGCAMVIIGDVPVGKGGWGRDLFSAKGFESYKQLTDLIHSGDCRACAQLHQSDSDVRAMFRHIPALLAGRADAAQMRTWLNEAVGPYISGLPARKIQEIAASFGEAAVQAQRAGFDMVQVHGDRMCGSLSSGLYNRRTDAYGGSLENRLRFAVEAVRAIRERLPQMPVDFKLVVRQENPHYGNAGLLPEELETAILLLERAGVTSFHVTLANHASLTDPIPPANHPHFGAEVGAISDRIGRGKHTTRHVELHPIEGGGYIADTPGFSSFDTEQMDLVLAEDLQYAFPEFEPYLGRCKFTGCAHVKEKGCAVRAAVEAGEIAKSRHESYVRLYESVKDLKEWELTKGGTR